MKWLNGVLAGLALSFSLNGMAEVRTHCGSVSVIDHPQYNAVIVQEGIDKTVSAFIIFTTPEAKEAARALLQADGTQACVVGEVERTEDGNVIRTETIRGHYNRSGIGVTIE